MMRTRFPLLAGALGAVVLAGVVAAPHADQAPQGQAGQPRPGGIMRRPGDGRTPEFPEPTITQYKPRTTLKTAQHPTPRAKFPVIDVHSHQPAPISDAQFAQVVQGMDANNLRVLVNASGTQGDRLVQAVAAFVNKAKARHDNTHFQAGIKGFYCQFVQYMSKICKLNVR